MRAAAVIAAAGRSSRMGEFKPLMVLDGETVIGRIVRALRDAGAEEIVAAAGHRGGELERCLAPLGVRVVRNRRFRETQMFDSLKLGIAALTGPWDVLFLLPGDVPLIRAGTLRAMMEQPGQAVRPVWNGRGGHPLMVRPEGLSGLLDYRGPDGLRGAVSARGLTVTDFPVEDRGCTLDADTREDWEEIRAVLHCGEKQRTAPQRPGAVREG